MAATERCELCGSAAPISPHTRTERGVEWAVAHCATCGEDFTFLVGEGLARRLDVPGSVAQVAIDHERGRLVVGWRNEEGTCGIRALHLASTYRCDLAVGAGVGLELLTAGEGMAVAAETSLVFPPRPDPASWADDEPYREVWPEPVVQASLVFDTADGRLLERRPPEAQPDSQPAVATWPPRARHFSAVGGDVEGSAGFDQWAALVEQYCAVRPLMRLKGLHHDGADIVDFHCQGRTGIEEWLLVVKGGAIRWHERLAHQDGRGSHLVAFDWNVTGFWVEAGYVVTTPRRDEVALLSLGRAAQG